MKFLAMLLAITLNFSAAAATPDLPPAYVPPQGPALTGRISIWGHGALAGRFDFIESLVRQWEDGFRKFHPGVQFDNRLHGTASAIGALYTGQGDLALMGREIWPVEINAFKEVKGYAPTGLGVVTGSYATRNRGYAIVAYVHKDNPLPELTLKQLDAIYGQERRRGGAAVHRWGELGLKGDWADRPVHPYSFSLARGFSDFLEEAVLLDSRRWRPEVREFADLPGSLGGATDGGQRMLDALAQDRDGIAFSGALYHHPDVRPIAIAAEDGGPFVLPSEATVMDHSYPLTRIISMFVDQAPGKPLPPHIREFIRYILSRDAQQAVLRDGGGYLPVLAPAAALELKKLETSK
ncbi:PstS family phosphate ABC transporter substrate-binding protein [Pelomonas sp. KK5]|uniref:PstS family phosphate ABC transporter substrate-binding protein n=1 Tax=Pelomonas sp. KK5 TaxID=1855730 RepID=UPI00117D37AB|nr:substrate-binding domain-containing protein [Pelomonas sp. KK5]